MKTFPRTLLYILVSALMWNGAGAVSPSLNLPKKVLSALNTKFPGAIIEKWTREKEDGQEIFDIEFKQGDQKLEADINARGVILNWERAIAASELPSAVMKAFNSHYANSTIIEVMQCTIITRGSEKPDGFEIVFTTGDSQHREVTIMPDGTIKEEPKKEVPPLIKHHQ